MNFGKFNKEMKAISDSDLINSCDRIISDLCKTGGSSWRLQVPPSINDPDILLSELVERFKSQQEWIPVEEGSPKVGQEVLVTQNPNTTATRESLFAVYNGKRFVPIDKIEKENDSYVCTGWSDIIAWLPKPQPYNPKKT